MSSTQRSLRTCKLCGRVALGSENFCVECGAPFETMQPTHSGETELANESSPNPSESTAKEYVYLNSLDGFEFEDFCAFLFRKLDYGRVEVMPYTGDQGRDLIIYTPQATKLVVECKHHPHGTIGRPVVQKLHSAVVTENAERGILVTTGRFSAEAVVHSKKIHPPIELVDLNLLRDLCDRAGIHLGTEGEPDSIFYSPFTNGQHVAASVIASFSPRIITRPIALGKALELHKSELKFRPVYRILYDVHQDFRTSVGLIHSIHLDKRELFLDGANGEIVRAELSDFLRDTPTLGDATMDDSQDAERGNFLIDQTTLMQRARETISRLNSKSVTYYGRNNVRYQTICVPGERSILVHDVKQVFIPEWMISFIAFSKRYVIRLIERPGRIFFLEKDISVCRICNKPIADQTLLCNSCGNFVHKGKSHGYECKSCQKTLCRSCTYWLRRWIFLKTYLCEHCATERRKLGKKPRQLLPEPPLKDCLNCGFKLHADAYRCTECRSYQFQADTHVS